MNIIFGYNKDNIFFSMKYSNFTLVQKNAKKYLGKTAKVSVSDRPPKKFKIFDPRNKKWVHFGQLGYEDYTKHRDKKRRQNYLNRSRKIKGNWKQNAYSPNNLSIHVLW